MPACAASGWKELSLEPDQFLALSANQISEIVQAAGKRVCAFPIEGTRRWFLLESRLHNSQDFMAHYVETATQRHVDLFRLIFDHGLTKLVAPLVGEFLLKRSPDYVHKAVQAMGRLAVHPTFVDFYDEYDVRVHFYGDYHRFFAANGCPEISNLFDEITERTQHHQTRSLFMGIFEDEPLATIVQLALRYAEEHGHAPDRGELIEMYYGEDISPIDLYIGYDRYSADEIPLLASGNQDLFFMMAPSLSLTETQLREMLHAHLFAPLNYMHDYTLTSAEEWAQAQAEYEVQRGRTFRVAVQPASGRISLRRTG